MDNIILSDIVKKALKYYDDKLFKYTHLFKINKDNIKINEFNRSISFNDIETFDFEFLGYFDLTNKIWIWGWVLNDFSNEHDRLCKYLLDYGLKLDKMNSTEEQMMIKSILVNSRIKIEEEVQLDVNIAIYLYLIRDRIKFIYKREIYLDNEKNHIVYFYYLVK
jgi:hypothetical protein